MNNPTIIIKVTQQLNKLASNDFSNIPNWAILEAFNKTQSTWCRQNLRGMNMRKEADEQSISRIDDLERLITTSPNIPFTKKDFYFESDISSWPVDYMRYKRLELRVISSCCDTPKRMTVYLGEEANLDIYLNDSNYKPNYDWGETIAMLAGNKIRILHEDNFDISSCKFIYYRQPRNIQMLGVIDVYTGTPSVNEVTCEFSDDLAELLCIQTAAVIAGNVSDYNNMQRLNQAADKTN